MRDRQLPAMTGAEMQATREYLGFTLQWIADKFAVGERRLHRMEADRERIPDFLVTFLDEAEAETKEIVTDLTAIYRRKVKAAEGTEFFKTYRNDELYAEADDSVPGVDGLAGVFRSRQRNATDQNAGERPCFQLHTVQTLLKKKYPVHVWP